MHPLLKRYPIVSDQVTATELSVLLTELEQTLRATENGAVVELGCYVGTSSLFFRRLMNQLAADVDERELHVYDSFAGLPDKTGPDQSAAGVQFVGGELKASKNQLITNFKKAGLTLPVIHTGWFEQLTPQDLPEQIAFAFLDGDFYSSIMASLKLVWPKLQPGARVVIDDYQAEALPGVQRALEDWSRQHSFSIRPVASLAIVKPGT